MCVRVRCRFKVSRSPQLKRRKSVRLFIVLWQLGLHRRAHETPLSTYVSGAIERQRLHVHTHQQPTTCQEISIEISRITSKRSINWYLLSKELLYTSYLIEFRSIVRSYTSVVHEVDFSYIKLHITLKRNGKKSLNDCRRLPSWHIKLTINLFIFHLSID